MVSTDMYYLNRVMANLFLETPFSEKDKTIFKTMGSITDFWAVKFPFHLCSFNNIGFLDSYTIAVFDLVIVMMTGSSSLAISEVFCLYSISSRLVHWGLAFSNQFQSQQRDRSNQVNPEMSKTNHV